MHILGTAGHVDHGKSSLVHALTGTDPDRWIEEKLRGMTLDLGFARLRFEDGVEAGIVDVPGHERFLHNMLAGAAGMELLLLVVAANEGPRPQTIEHLAILSYLNVRRALVVLAKSDLVDDEQRWIAEQAVRTAVVGTVAQNAPVIAVSTVTGEGLDTLRQAIHDALRDLPPRAPDAPPYLPIDRAFALPGHGTIVTGTLMQGEFGVGDTLALTPGNHSARVRTLEVFGERRERVSSGARVAVNVPSLEVAEAGRGAVLASPQLVPQPSFAVAFKAYAPNRHMLRRRMPVRAYVGSAEIIGTLQFDDAPPSRDDEAQQARLHLRAATIGLPGAAFVVRRLSPKDLLGGGTFRGASASDEANPRDDSTAGALLAALRAAGWEGAPASALGAAANVRAELAADVLERLHEDGRVLKLAKPDAYVDLDAVAALQRDIATVLERNEAAAPWALGTTLLALARALRIPEPALLRILARLAEDGRIASRAGYYATPAFAPQLTAEQRAFFDRELSVRADQPYLPASLTEITAHMRAARVPGLSAAFDTLVGSGAVVKVGEAVYRTSQIAQVRRQLEQMLQRDGELTMARFRDLVGTSRKYAVPLLEWFDATGVTVRTGDVRRLRKRDPDAPT